MQQLTSGLKLGQDKLAIIFNNRVICAPIVQSTLGEEFRISGVETLSHARWLKACLCYPMPHTVTLEEYKSAEK